MFTSKSCSQVLGSHGSGPPPPHSPNQIHIGRKACFSQPGCGSDVWDEDEDRSWEIGGWDEAGDSKLRQRNMPGISVAGTRNHRGAAGHEAKADWIRSQRTWEAVPGSEAFSCRKWRRESSWVRGGVIDFFFKAQFCVELSPENKLAKNFILRLFGQKD